MSESSATPSRRSRSTRRHVVAAALAAVASVVLVGCTSSSTGSGSTGGSQPSGSGSAPSTSQGTSGSGSGQAVTLDFWTWIPNPQNAVTAFNAAHSDVRIKLTPIPGGAQGGNAKLFAALKAGNAPCLAQAEYQSIPDFLMSNGLMDISKYVDADKSKFVNWQWQQGVYGSKVYSIPMASGPMALYYRADMFKAAGITTPPATWAEYAADAAKVKAKYPNAFISTSPTSYGNYLAALAQQQGATWFSHSNDTWNVRINGAGTKEVTDYWTNLISKNLVKNENPFGAGFNTDLASNHFAAYIGASWTDSLIRAAAPKQSGLWRVAPLPQWTSSGDKLGGNWGGSSIAVMTGCKYPQQAAEAAVWLMSNPTSVSMLVNDGYGWPAVSNLTDIQALTSSTVFKYYGGQNINLVFGQADKVTNEKWTSVPGASQAYADLTTDLASTSSPDQVLDTIQQQTVAYLKSKGVKVEEPAS